jgi:hypothetical protein
MITESLEKSELLGDDEFVMIDSQPEAAKGTTLGSGVVVAGPPKPRVDTIDVGF